MRWDELGYVGSVVVEPCQESYFEGRWQQKVLRPCQSFIKSSLKPTLQSNIAIVYHTAFVNGGGSGLSQS